MAKRAQHLAYLGLGTNLGDRAANIAAALQALGQLGAIVAASSLLETSPWGVLDQPMFLNAAAILRTTLSPRALLKAIKRIEDQLGRTPTYRWGPRLIDIDILLYDDLVVSTPELTIPHAQMQERAFVLLPLREIAPDVVHPMLKKTIAELAENAEQ